MYRDYYVSPIGIFKITANESSITGICVVDNIDKVYSNSILMEAIKQLHEYFKGDRTSFSFSVEFKGTPFEKAVYKKVIDIPYGTTMSYQDVAAAINHKNAYRAVGNALNKNPLALFTPCHRVTKKGSLGGFGFGVSKKAWLLKHEGDIKF